MLASTSAQSFQMSRLPSPSPSTAKVLKLDGMNWPAPIAPAYEPMGVLRVEAFLAREQQELLELAAEELARGG
jgi:hypothetical protein